MMVACHPQSLSHWNSNGLEASSVSISITRFRGIGVASRRSGWKPVTIWRRGDGAPVCRKARETFRENQRSGTRSAFAIPSTGSFRRSPDGMRPSPRISPGSIDISAERFPAREFRGEKESSCGTSPSRVTWIRFSVPLHGQPGGFSPLPSFPLSASAPTPNAAGSSSTEAGGKTAAGAR